MFRRRGKLVDRFSIGCRRLAAVLLSQNFVYLLNYSPHASVVETRSIESK